MISCERQHLNSKRFRKERIDAIEAGCSQELEVNIKESEIGKSVKFKTLCHGLYVVFVCLAANEQYMYFLFCN